MENLSKNFDTVRLLIEHTEQNYENTFKNLETFPPKINSDFFMKFKNPLKNLDITL